MNETTLNWRIRKHNDEEDSFFFIEADLPNAEENKHYPRVELMQEDFGEHNGYTYEIRMKDAQLIVSAPNMKNAINDVLELLNSRHATPNLEWIKHRLSESILTNKEK